MINANLYELSFNGDSEQLFRVLTADSSGVRLRDRENGMSPIHWAANGGQADCIKILLDFGADVNAVDRQDHITALHIVMARGHAVCAKILITNGADINALSNKRESPLHVAAWAGHLNCIKILLDSGAILNLKESRYGDAALHKAAGGGHSLCVKYLVECGADVNMRNKDGRTPLHCAASADSLECFRVLVGLGADVNARGLDNKKPFSHFRKISRKHAALLSVELSLEHLSFRHFELWFYLLQSVDIPGIDARIHHYAFKYPSLIHAKDHSGRAAIDMATPQNKLAITSICLWHGKYRVSSEQPEHVSSSCVVYLATDEGSLDSNGQPNKVALKLMKCKSQFLRECHFREHAFSEEFVVNMIGSHPAFEADMKLLPDEVPVDFSLFSTSPSSEVKALAESLYCIVLPWSDRNLFVGMKQYNLSGPESVHNVRQVFTQLVHCVEHMHSKGILHGDIKPLNILCHKLTWRLTDLDCSCRVGIDTISRRTSTAFAPPEAFYACESNNTIMLRSKAIKGANVDGKDRIDPLIAHPSFDVWSLGCVLYQLCTTESLPLFVGGREDCLLADRQHEDNLWVLSEWSEITKQKKLSRVHDPIARNLITQMLSKQPSRRPSLSRILAHPFMSLRNVVRMIGEKPQYDVYLSYRGSSDVTHAALLYKQLTERGISVWWDRKCLSAEYAWRDEFCAGLLNSATFVCILSRQSINNPRLRHQNFGHLSEDSCCDDLLLEYRLALELRSMGYIERIFPVLVGDATEVTGASTVYGNFFSGGCLPRVKDVCVSALVTELMSHMHLQSIGEPTEPNRTVSSILSAIVSCDGSMIEGSKDIAFAKAVEDITGMLSAVDNSFELRTSRSPLNKDGGPPSPRDETDMESLPSPPAFDETIKQMAANIRAQMDENRQLRQQLMPLLAKEKAVVEELQQVKQQTATEKHVMQERLASVSFQLASMSEAAAAATTKAQHGMRSHRRKRLAGGGSDKESSCASIALEEDWESGFLASEKTCSGLWDYLVPFFSPVKST